MPYRTQGRESDPVKPLPKKVYCCHCRYRERPGGGNPYCFNKETRPKLRALWDHPESHAFGAWEFCKQLNTDNHCKYFDAFKWYRFWSFGLTPPLVVPLTVIIAGAWAAFYLQMHAL